MTPEMWSKQKKGWAFLISGEFTDRLERHIIVRNCCYCILRDF